MSKASVMRYSIEEVFEIAKRIEQNGYNFYVKAAELWPEHSTFFQKMAEQEKGHEKTFDALAAKLVREEEKFLSTPGSQDVMKYLEALGDQAVFMSSGDQQDVFPVCENVEQVFNEAILREEKAILFFLGIKEMMLDGKGRESVDHLIHEEMKHISWIKQQAN